MFRSSFILRGGVTAFTLAFLLAAGTARAQSDNQTRAFPYRSGGIDGARRVPTDYASPLEPLDPPVFMTSINYPGVMGMYYRGRGNSFTPIGEPFGPSAAPYVTTRTMTYRDEAAAGNTARINVRVPLEADLYLNGERTTKTGTLRTLYTPTLRPGRDYDYTLTARWYDRGTPMEATRTVTVSAGDRITVRLLEPETPGPVRSTNTLRSTLPGRPGR